MANPLHKILATNLTVWWVRLSFKEKLLLIGLAFLAAITLPITVFSAQTKNRTIVDAQVNYLSTKHNKTPNISPQEFNCRVNVPCSFQVRAVDPDITDELHIDIDFLPAELKLTQCEHKSTFTSNLGIACAVEGTPTKAAKFVLLATVTDSSGVFASEVVNLNIR